MKTKDGPATTTPDLRKYAWLAIAAAMLTVLLKGSAWAITGSVSLLSDAAESMVNLVAAIVALVSLTIAARPADDGHHFGHSKAEYFSALLEGVMIFVAAASIIYLGVERLLNPQPLQSLGIGLAISVVAAVLNGVVGQILIKVGTRHRSITLRADGRHLMTDVYTTAGVVVGLGLAW
ncbi:MAG: cation transporter, partial [Pseudoxanthomonas sp.]|nr:cation transporter [Pseudoxanthomonas sp.]